MQFKQITPRPLKAGYYFLILCLFFSTIHTQAQTTYLPQGDKANILLERLEIKAKKDSALNFSKLKPFSRLKAISSIYNIGENNQLAYRLTKSVCLSRVDLYNLYALLRNNYEYLPDSLKNVFKSKKPIGKNFYTTPANLYEVHVKDFDLVINPVIQVTVSKEKDNGETLYQNTRG